MRKIIFAILASLLLCGQASLGGFPPGIFDNTAALSVSSGGVCTSATNFLARTSGLSGTAKTNYTNLLCGLASDGIGCGQAEAINLDALYVLAAPDSTTELLNLCSSSYSLVSHGTNTFTANVGSQGNGTNGYLNTQATLNALTNYTLNSASYGGYILTNRTVAQDYELGADVGGSTYAAFAPTYSAAITYYNINDVAATSYVSSTAQGMWIITRTSSTAVALYRNGSSVASSGSSNAVSLAALSFYISARNHSGSATSFGTDQYAFVFLGPGLNATQAGKLSTRFNTFATALGINVY